MNKKLKWRTVCALRACGLAASLGIVHTSAQPANDNFASRLPLTGSNITFQASNVGATAELCPDETAFEPSHSPFDPDAHRSVWHTWTSPVNGGAVVQVVSAPSSSFSTPALAVYQGNALCTLHQVVANSSSFHRARAVFDAQQGFSYQIALDGAIDGGEGVVTASLKLAPLPTNAFISRATLIAGNSYTTSGSFIGGTVASPQSLYWVWTAPTNNGVSSSQVSLAADAISFPPELRVWTGPSYQSLTPVTLFHLVDGAMSNGMTTNGMSSRALFTATAGSNYFIRLAGWQQDPSGSDISERYGTFRFRLNNRALALSIFNVVTNSANSVSPVSFTADARIENLGLFTSNPLRVSVSARPGLSVIGPDAGLIPNGDVAEGVWPLDLSHCAAPPAGLVSWWRAECNADDSVGGNHGTLSGGTGFAAGRVGQAFSLDGVDDVITVGATPIAPPWTAEFWVNRQAASDDSAILIGDGFTALKLEQWPNLKTVGFTRFAENDYSFTYSAPVGVWVHLVFVGTAANTQLYVDGNLRETYAASIALPRGQLGGDMIDPPRFRNHVKGLIDEVSLYNRALAAGEIRALYLAGSAGKCIGPSTAAPPATQQNKIPLWAMTPGSEQVQLVANGNFEQPGPPADSVYLNPDGWTRSGEMYVATGTHPTAADQLFVAQAWVSTANPAEGYQRTLTLQPATQYVLSAYLWNFGNANHHVTAVVDLNDAPNEAQLTLYATDPQADLGHFAYATFNTANTGTQITLRCFYDGFAGTGAAPRYHPVGAQWDNIAITRADLFHLPSLVGTALVLAPGQSVTIRICGTIPGPNSTGDPAQSAIGFGYGAYAQLEQQLIPDRWFAVDEQLVAFGNWPVLGTGDPGPGGGVIRLDPGYGIVGNNGLTSVAVLGPAAVPEGSSTNYAGRASWRDGTVLHFTNTAWSASQFSITTNGVFTPGSVASNTVVTLFAPVLDVSSGFIFTGAANVTVLNVLPFLGAPKWQDGKVVLTLNCFPGRSHVLEAATSLVPPATLWQALATNAPPNGVWSFVDATTYPRRFYRVREPP